jgi:TP901 family phage tail tape measure protein
MIRGTDEAMPTTPDHDNPEPYPWTLAELAAAIAIFSHANVRSARGGKALGDAMSTLLRPSELATQTLDRLGVNAYEPDGQLQPLSSLIAQLERANPAHSDYWRIFGIQTGATISQLVRYRADTLSNLANQVGSSEDALLLMSDTKDLVGEPPRYNRLRQLDDEER